MDRPAQPAALFQVSLLMADDGTDLKAASAVIESDMALAAAMMKAVNSSLYGLRGRVGPVRGAQALPSGSDVASVIALIARQAAVLDVVQVACAASVVRQQLDGAR